jgi:hypothetical protein
MSTETVYQKPLYRMTVGEGIAASFRQLVRGNYLYLLSAALMLWGTYHLMYSSLFTGTMFARTLKALLVLQAYEVLVIATAVLIVRRMKALDDAFMLLLVEVVLLLDPTFFSNHFGAEFYRNGRLISPHGIWVNDACFLLAPFKLLILLWGLRLKLARRGWLAFVFAAFCVYMTEWLILQQGLLPEWLVTEPKSWWNWSRNGYFYLLAWMPLVFAALLPQIRDLIQVRGGLVVAGEEEKGFVTASRRRILNHAFLWLPLVILFAHFIESSSVHEVFFYPMHLAPLVLALGVLWIANSNKNHLAARAFTLDALVAVAIVLSLPSSNVPRPLRFGDVADVPDFMAWRVPLLACGVLVVALYGWFYRRYQYRPALYRAVALCCLGGGAALFHAEIVRETLALTWNTMDNAVMWLWNGFWGAVGKALRWIADHPASYLSVLWVGLIALAWKFRNAFTLFVAGGFTIFLVFGSLPGSLVNWTAEILQCLFVLGIVLDHKFSPNGKRQLRYFFAWMVMVMALLRLDGASAIWTWKGAVLALECAGFVAAGILLRHPGYALVGALEGILCVHLVALAQGLYGQPALVILTLGLGVFAAGVAITFNKQRILAWLGEPGAVPIVSPPALDDTPERVEAAEEDPQKGTEASGTEDRSNETERTSD